MPAETSKRRRRHPKDTHGVPVASEMIGVSRSTLYRWIKQGKVRTLERTYKGEHVALHVDEIERLKADGAREIVDRDRLHRFEEAKREALDFIRADDEANPDGDATVRQLQTAWLLYQLHIDGNVHCDAYEDLLDLQNRRPKHRPKSPEPEKR